MDKEKLSQLSDNDLLLIQTALLNQIEDCEKYKLSCTDDFKALFDKFTHLICTL